MHIIKILLIGSLLITAICQAVPVTDQIYLNYSGTVVIPPCTIVTPAVAVNFGDIPATDLETSDSATDWKSAKVELTECNDVSEVVVTISSTQNSADNLYIANSGTAEHLGVQAKMSAPNVMPILDGISIPIPLLQRERTVLMAFDFRIHNDGSGPATSGSVKSVITLVFTFK